MTLRPLEDRDLDVLRSWNPRGYARPHRLTIDPAAANERAIGAFFSLGFEPVGIMRRHERGFDGVWRDGLMDLLADELA